jgi:hypothetical protein
MRKPLEPLVTAAATWQLQAWSLVNGTKGRRRREASPATGEGNPLKAKAQGRYRHETRLDRLQAEGSVKRSRKPEDAAKPGEASPAYVAACFRKRRRAPNPMEGPPDSAHRAKSGRSFNSPTATGWSDDTRTRTSTKRTARAERRVPSRVGRVARLRAKARDGCEERGRERGGALTCVAERPTERRNRRSWEP